MNAVTVPTSDAIADRAYAAMHRHPPARIAFERILSLSGTMRAVDWHSMTPDEQTACSAYTARRLELREVYGEGAAQIQAREDCLAWLRRDEAGIKAADKIAWVKRYYARGSTTFADFIADWGYTNDPRLLSEGKNPVVAFSLFPKQRDMIAWMIDRCWLRNKPGVVVKSRDVGASWVAMALLATLCIYRHGVRCGRR